MDFVSNLTKSDIFIRVADEAKQQLFQRVNIRDLFIFTIRLKFFDNVFHDEKVYSLNIFSVVDMTQKNSKRSKSRN